MRITFDNSIHLGQFDIVDEARRVAAKNSQAMLSQKPETTYVGVEAFNENTYSDHLIWTLSREPQDYFYKFMDIYHTITHVERIPLNVENAKLALDIQKKLGIDMSNALTCAVAALEKVDEIHSFYGEMKSLPVVKFMAEKFNIRVTLPPHDKEASFFDAELESHYQAALQTFRRFNIHLPALFHA
jgi:hypothetical protein